MANLSDIFKDFDRWDLVGEAALTGVAGYVSATAGMKSVAAQRGVATAQSIASAKQAQEFRNSIPDIKLAAAQQHNDIIGNLSDWMAVAGATAGYMNMTDNTLDAISKRVTKDAAEQASRVSLQAVRETAKTLTEAEARARAGVLSAETGALQAKLGTRQVYAQALGTGASLLKIVNR